MIIARRDLMLRDGNRQRRISVRLFAPKLETSGSWACRYEVDWPGESHSITAFGFDGVQSIFIALQMIGAEIYTSNYHKDGNLYWDKPGNGYGFPIASTLRDLLRGDDVKYV